MNATSMFISFSLFACFALPCFANTTCEDALTEIKSLLVGPERGQRFVVDGDVCSGCSGRPGKSGAIGPPGPPGPPGGKGTCTCDLTSIVPQLREFQGMCYVGISTGAIKLSQLSASSVHSGCPFGHVVLNSGGAWCAATSNANQWVQVDFLVSRTITGVVTRGRANSNQWVTTYHVSYGDDVTQMRYYSESHEPKLFVGNSDRNTVVENMFNAPISARYVRIHPVGYQGHMSMRIELRQC